MDEKDISLFCNRAYECVNNDFDLTNNDAIAVSEALAELLRHCDAQIGVEDDTRYTLSLLDMWICFAQPYGVPGGSHGDYCSESVRKAMRDTFGALTLRADEYATNTLRRWIEEGAFEPERWIGMLETDGVL